MRLSLLTLCLGTVLLAGCSSNPYSVNQATAHFSGKTNITSNVDNLCMQTNGKYAIKITQHLASGFPGKTWYGCTANEPVSTAGSYFLYFSIIKNDGTGKKIVSDCRIRNANNTLELHNANVIFNYNDNTPHCVVNVS